MGSVKWYGTQVRTQVRGVTAKRILAAAIYLVNKIKESLSTSQPTIGSGGSKKGLDPSRPGDYPKLVTGFLRRGVTYEMDYDTPSARVGTNVPYGRYLELGTRKMARRPWLTNGLRDFAAGMKSLLTSGKES